MMYEVEIDDGRGGIVTKEYACHSMSEVIYQTDAEIAERPKSRVKSVYARDDEHGRKTLIIRSLSPE